MLSLALLLVLVLGGALVPGRAGPGGRGRAREEHVLQEEPPEAATRTWTSVKKRWWGTNSKENSALAQEGAGMHEGGAVQAHHDVRVLHRVDHLR